jgi:RNA polymerase sigma factor (TIGR02999 family)
MASASALMPDNGPDVTELLQAWGEGDRAALDELMPLVYDTLRRLAHRQRRRERTGTLGTTALVHEAYLRLVDQRRARLESRQHFFGLAARVMRRVLVDGARRRQAAKRGGGDTPVTLDEAVEPGAAPDRTVLALDEALTRLEAFDVGLSRVVELHYFGGLTFEETAESLGVSTAKAWRDWTTARAWLHEALRER